MNQQQLGEAERLRKEQERESKNFWSSKFGKIVFWAVIIMLGVSYCSDQIKDKTTMKTNAPEVSQKNSTK